MTAQHTHDDPDRLTVACPRCVERAEAHRWANAPLREVTAHWQSYADVVGVEWSWTGQLPIPVDATAEEARDNVEFDRYWGESLFAAHPNLTESEINDLSGTAWLHKVELGAVVQPDAPLVEQPALFGGGQ